MLGLQALALLRTTFGGSWRQKSLHCVELPDLTIEKICRLNVKPFLVSSIAVLPLKEQGKHHNHNICVLLSYTISCDENIEFCEIPGTTRNLRLFRIHVFSDSSLNGLNELFLSKSTMNASSCGCCACWLAQTWKYIVSDSLLLFVEVLLVGHREIVNRLLVLSPLVLDGSHRAQSAEFAKHVHF